MCNLLELTTNDWLSMSTEEKENLVVLIGRWWEDYENIIVENYDDMIQILDHQTEQYFKNGVDISLFETACELYSVDATTYIAG